MKPVAVVAALLLTLLGVAACGTDALDPAPEPAPPSSHELQSLREKGEDQYIEDETLAANAELLECLELAGEEDAKRATCRAVFEARLRRVLMVLKYSKAISEEQVPR